MSNKGIMGREGGGEIYSLIFCGKGNLLLTEWFDGAVHLNFMFGEFFLWGFGEVL